MELKTMKAKFTIEPGGELQCETSVDDIEENFLKKENEKLKCQLDEMKYKLEKTKKEKVEKEKASEYQIFLKGDMVIIANVKEGECPGIVWEGLISYGDVTVSLDEFKCAVPVKCDNE